MQATTSTTAVAASPAAVQDDGLIFGLGSEDAWDQAVVGSPVVRESLCHPMQLHDDHLACLSYHACTLSHLISDSHSLTR